MIGEKEMYLTDEELCMVEQLAYLDEEGLFCTYGR